MITPRTIFIFVLFLLLVNNFSFTEETEKTLTLEECISMALINNISLKMQQQAVREAEAKWNQLKKNRLPQFESEASYIRFSEVMEADITKNLNGLPFSIPPAILRFGDEDNYSAKLSLIQPIFTGFKLINSIIASEYQLRGELLNKLVQQNNLIYQVKQTFFNLLNAQQNKRAAKLSAQVVDAHLQDLKNMYAQGMVSHNEVLKAELKKSETELMILQLDNQINLLKLALLNIIGLDLTTTFEIKEELLFQSTSTPAASISQTALIRRPEIAQIDYSIKGMTHLLKSTRGDYYPTILFIGSYEYGKPGLNKLEKKWMDYWTLGLVVRWSLWDWGIRQKKVDQMQAALDRLQQNKQHLQNAIYLDVYQASLQKQEAEQRVRITKNAVMQAGENLRLATDQFHQGLTTNTEFLDAETKFTNAKINEIRAITDYHIAVANVERALGNMVNH